MRQQDQVAVLTFGRPPDNFMDFPSMIELGDHLDHLATADLCTVVLLASRTDGMFINHAELSDLAKAGAGRASAAETQSWSRAVRLLEEIPQPTVAAVDGLASGGGNEIALACTLRVASPRALFQQPEVPIGIIPGGGGSVRLPRLVGPARAAEAILSGRAVPAREALDVGWVNAMLPADDFTANAVRWAAAIAAQPRPALAAAKQSIIAGVRLPFPDAQALEQRLFRELSTQAKAT